MCKSETEPIHIIWKTFLSKKYDVFKTTGGTLQEMQNNSLGNEEAMAIELIMVRYCWAFAYFSEAEPLINKIRDKVTTTFKSNSATTEDHQ